MKRKKILLFCIVPPILIICGLIAFFPLTSNRTSIDSNKISVNEIKVGYLSITPNLPFYVAIEKDFFKKQGLHVTPVLFKSSNQLIDALITNRIQFTTVSALSVIFSLEAASPGLIKIYQVNYIIKSDPNDFLLVKKDSKIKSIKDLKGKKIALFPGSNFNVWSKIIFGKHFNFGNNIMTISLPPQNHIQALAAGSVDASYCLEPTASIGLEKGVVRILDTGLVCKYIFNPFPVTGNIVLSSYAEQHPNITKKFCNAMDQARLLVKEHPELCRKYLIKYCNISKTVADKVKLGHGKPANTVDIQNLEAALNLYREFGVVTKNVNVKKMLLKLQ